MRRRTVFSALIDLGASVLAIALVLGTCLASERVSMDFRAMFSLTCVAFFLAGWFRGISGSTSIFWQSVRLSVGGLLGIAALIINNGFHRLLMPACLIFGAMLSSLAGILVRRLQRSDRTRAFRVAGGWIIACAITALAVLPRLSASSAFDTRQSRIKPFTLSVDGHPVSSGEMRGHVVVLAFWASWCLACYGELPHVQNVYAKYRNDPRVVFYLVDTGWMNETAEKGRKALLRHGLDAPMAFDAGELAQDLAIDSLPALVVIDRDGNIRSKHFGFDNSENLEQGLEKQLRSAMGAD